MKTTKFIAIALFATCLVACGGKQKANDASADSTNVEATDSTVAAAAGITSVDQIQSAGQITDSIKAAIETGDQQKAETLVTLLQQKVEQIKAAGDETSLKEYAQQIADLCKDKAEQIKSLGTVGNAISTAATATGVEDAVSALKTLGIDAASVGDAAVDGAKSAAESAVNDAKSKAESAVNDAKSKANEAVSNAKSKANEAVNNAKSKANDAVKSAAKSALGL